MLKENKALRMFSGTELKTRIEAVMKERIYYIMNIAFQNAMESTKLNIIVKKVSAKALRVKEYVHNIRVTLLK